MQRSILVMFLTLALVSVGMAEEKENTGTHASLVATAPTTVDCGSDRIPCSGGGSSWCCTKDPSVCCKDDNKGCCRRGDSGCCK